MKKLWHGEDFTKFGLKPGVKKYTTAELPSTNLKKEIQLTFICLVMFSNKKKTHTGQKIVFSNFPARARSESADFQNFVPGPGPAHSPPVTRRASPARGEHWTRYLPQIHEQSKCAE